MLSSGIDGRILVGYLDSWHDPSDYEAAPGSYLTGILCFSLFRELCRTLLRKLLRSPAQAKADKAREILETVTADPQQSRRDPKALLFEQLHSKRNLSPASHRRPDSVCGTEYRLALLSKTYDSLLGLPKVERPTKLFYC